MRKGRSDVNILDLVRLHARIDAHKHSILRFQDARKSSQKLCRFVALEVAYNCKSLLMPWMAPHTDTGSQVKDSLGLPLNVLKPLFTIVVGPPKPMARDVLIGGKLGKGALKLAKGKVKGVVVDILASVLESLKEEVCLTKVASRCQLRGTTNMSRLTRFRAR